MMKKLPRFKTEEEEIKFWETHSTSRLAVSLLANDIT